jgi:hypothetical protein
MGNVVKLPKLGARFYELETVRQMLRGGLPLPLVVKVYGTANQRAEEEEQRGPLAKGRAAAILLQALAETLAGFTDEQSAMLKQRAALFADIDTSKLTDKDWRRLATLGLPRNIARHC